MPCDQVLLNSVDLGKMNGELLKRALEALGAYGSAHRFTLQGVSCRISDGKLIVPEGSEHLADTLKRVYSAEVVKYTARRNGWAIKQTGEFAYEVTK